MTNLEHRRNVTHYYLLWFFFTTSSKFIQLCANVEFCRSLTLVQWTSFGSSNLQPHLQGHITTYYDFSTLNFLNPSNYAHMWCSADHYPVIMNVRRQWICKDDILVDSSNASCWAENTDTPSRGWQYISYSDVKTCYCSVFMFGSIMKTSVAEVPFSFGAMCNLLFLPTSVGKISSLSSWLS